jgi:hypothetical protein
MSHDGSERGERRERGGRQLSNDQTEEARPEVSSFLVPPPPPLLAFQLSLSPISPLFYSAVFEVSP